jgi:hypothetical protein
MSTKKLLLALVGSLTLSVIGEPATRSERMKKRKEVRSHIRADVERIYKKGRILDEIAHAQQENDALTREALVAGWAQRAVDRIKKDEMRGRFAHTYSAPVVSPALHRFGGTHCAAAQYELSYVGNGFSDDGTVVDSSVVRFGKKPLISDLLLASKMSAHAAATPGAGCEFLQDLADTPLHFQVATTTHECAISYTLGMARNRFQIGCCVPVRHQIRSLRMVPQLTSTTQALLRDRSFDEDDVIRNDIFRDFYGLSVRDMVIDVISRKNMEYNESLSHTSLGDVSFFATVNFFPWRLDRWTVSVECIVPGETTINASDFYPLMPSSEGGTSIKVSTSVVGMRTKLGTPYMTLAGRYYLPVTIRRRVPRMVSVSEVSSLPSTEVFGDEISFDPLLTTVVAETTLADFASQTAVAGLRPGFGLDVRFGSVIKPFASPLLQLDVYYALHMRGSDELRAGLARDEWNTDAILSPVHRSQHRVGVGLTYQPTQHCTLRCGVNGIVAGRSMPLELVAFVGLSAVA